VTRYIRLVALAEENLKAHNQILSNVQKRFTGGRAGEGDLEQTKERVDAAKVALTEFQRSLEDAHAKFRKTIGVEPYNLRWPGRLSGLPTSKDQVLAVTLKSNPTIKAAQADTDAAREAFHSTAGAFLPNVSLEARATDGNNEDGFFGWYSQNSLQVVATWDIFRGGQDSWKRKEAAERYNEASMAHARLQRDAFESVDKAWAARVITAQRITDLESQVAADRKVISAYSKEYDLGQRSLIDLLNAENQSFNAHVSLVSARSVAVFADYQLLAAMGKLLDYLRAPHPVDAEPLLPGTFGLFPLKVPPVMIDLPHPGSEPLNVKNPPATTYDKSVPPAPARPEKMTFQDRWVSSTETATAAPITQGQQSAAAADSGQSLGYTESIFSPNSFKQIPGFPTQSAKALK
jgi:adhesin transport system outer membrane protein